MIGLDTNVLARFLVEDDPAQCARARAVMEKSVEEGEDLYIPKIVLCELVWVLDRGYRFPRPRLISVLLNLLRAKNLVFEDREQVRAALEAFQAGSADFADYLIVEQCFDAGCDQVMSFDGSLAADTRVTQPAR